MNKDMQSMISSYIEGDLSRKDKAIFESYMDKNLEFSKKIHIIKNMINQFNNQEILVPSENFIDNLHSKISELSRNSQIASNRKIEWDYWFATNLKATLGFSFIIIFISMFFINRISTRSEINISNTDNNLLKNTVPEGLLTYS